MYKSIICCAWRGRHGVGLGPHHHQRQASKAHGEGGGVEGADVRPQRVDLREEVGRHLLYAQAQ